MTWLLAIFLLAHGLIHASFISPRPPATAGGPEWPFELSRSWLLSPLGLDGDVGRAIGVLLLVVSVIAFAVAAASAAGVVAETVFAPAVGAGAIASLALLVVFFHPWLVLGVAIDAILLWATLVARWTPQSGFPS